MELLSKIYLLLLSFLNLLRPGPQDIKHTTITTFQPASTPTFIPLTPTKRPLPQLTKIPSPLPTDSGPWGIAKQTGEHTWTMKIGEDQNMATPAEILSALNEYRYRYSSQTLALDSKLTTYAQSRVDYFNKIGNIDSHAGFENFLNHEDGFKKLGFSYLGENISIGYRLNGVHLIEWIYAGDEPHNKNQLDSKWDHVGIAVKGTATCLIFATGKM